MNKNLKKALLIILLNSQSFTSVLPTNIEPALSKLPVLVNKVATPLSILATGLAALSALIGIRGLYNIQQGHFGTIKKDYRTNINTGNTDGAPSYCLKLGTMKTDERLSFQDVEYKKLRDYVCKKGVQQLVCGVVCGAAFLRFINYYKK